LLAKAYPGRDAPLLIAGQAVRAAGYGFTAVLLGALLAARGYSHLRAGVVLTALIAGTALSSLVVGVLAEQDAVHQATDAAHAVGALRVVDA
jgi:hypothetical protein